MQIVREKVTQYYDVYLWLAICGHLVPFGWKRDCCGLFKFSIH